MIYGEVAEWSKAPVLKTGVGQPTVSSNLTLSALFPAIIVMMSESEPVRWSAYEHEYIERGSDWFWALGIVTLCIALTSILFSNVLFAIIIVLAAISIGLLARQEPVEVEFEISDKGLRVGPHMHRWSEIISFWVEDEHLDRHGRPLLLVDTKKILSPNLVIPIDNIEPPLVRAYLKERAKEIPMKEPVAHKILEWLGF
jgi:hypothetical protein